MKIKNKTLPLCFVSSFVVLGSSCLSATPPVYIGADVAKSSYSMKSGYGKNVFGHDPVVLNLFAGYRFNENVQVELGYETHKAKHRTATVDAGDSLPGLAPTPGNQFDVLRTKMRLQNIDLS